MVLEKLHIYNQKITKPRYRPIPFTKSNSKCIVDQNVKFKIVKLIDSNRGPCDKFLDKTPKAQSIKGITDKLDFLKIKNYCSEKHTIQIMKR